MEKQFPKNVRQIGNVSDEPKIYVEDYVDTYLSQLRTRAVDKPLAALLVGEIAEQEGQAVVYISGALQMKEIKIEGTEIQIEKETQEELEKDVKKYFSKSDTVGWCLIENGHPMSLNRGANKIHGKLFGKENSIFIWKDAVENDEMFSAYKYGELMQMGGHYIYYEKNPDMQNYMINTRKQNGVTPSEVVEDRAAKDFRSTIREKTEYKVQHRNSGLLYVTSVLLVVVVLAIGISTVNNFDKMTNVQNSLESLSRSMNGTAKEEKTDGQAAGQEVSGDVVEASEEIPQPEKVQPEKVQPEKVQPEKVQPETKEPASASSEGGDLSEEEFYTVKKGDTLDSISIKVYGNRGHVEAICKMNGLSDGNLIFIGQKLLLP